MTGNSNALPGASPKGQNQNREDRANDRAQKKDTTPPGTSKALDLDACRRSVRRALAGVAILIHDWPGAIRYSYFIGSNGKLLSRGERSASR